MVFDGLISYSPIEVRTSLHFFHTLRNWPLPLFVESELAKSKLPCSTILLFSSLRTDLKLNNNFSCSSNKSNFRVFFWNLNNEVDHRVNYLNIFVKPYYNKRKKNN